MGKSETTLRVAFGTLGCKVNFAESSHFSRLIAADEQFKLVQEHEEADVYVVHSCILTSTAEKKTRQMISRFHRRNPSAAIIVIGCMSQLAADKLLQLPGVKVVLGNQAKFDLISVLKQIDKFENIYVRTELDHQTFHIAWSSTDRTRAFLKIQDGCDSFCSYCIVPYARGRSRSAPIEEVRVAVQSIAQEGFREVVLTGINLGDYGKSSGTSLFDVIKIISEVPQIERIRLSSLEPHWFTEEFINHLQYHEKLMPHFHIPVQSGCDATLQRMRRKYDTVFLLKVFERLHRSFKNVCIACDVIAGYPGETEEEFWQTYEFFANAPISYMHVFSFSARKNTAAAQLNEQLHPFAIHQRAKILIELSDKKLLEFYEQNLMQKRKVLIEGLHSQNQNEMFGYTDNYIRVVLPFEHSKVNTIRQVLLKELRKEQKVVVGEIIERQY